jgi:hypothetical protein
MPEQRLDDLEAAEKLLVLACRRTVPAAAPRRVSRRPVLHPAVRRLIRL